MYSAVRQISYSKRVTSKTKILSLVPSKRISERRNTSGQTKECEILQDISETISFYKNLSLRQNEAFRSAVFRVDNKKNFAEIHKLCSSCGNVSQMFSFKIGSSDFILVEMKSVEEMFDVLNFSRKNNFYGVSNYSLGPFVHFKMSKLNENMPIELYGKVKEVSLKSKNLKEIFSNRKTILTVSEKVFQLYNEFKIKDVAMRLRFLMWRQVQSLINVVMPEASVYPFGSLVNGFGSSTSDLDLVVLKDNGSLSSTVNNYVPGDRSIMQAQLGIINDVIRGLMTGCCKVNYIKHAKVPIVKYHHNFTGIKCDLSMDCASGVQMSHVLFQMANFDCRVKPLIFTIKIWAQTLNLTTSQPSEHITNFALTLLIIFFLQQPTQSHAPILPPLSNYFNSQESLYEREAMPHLESNNAVESLPVECLLLLFLRFTSSFNFDKYGCCVNTGKIIDKNFSQALYIRNPSNFSLNVSKNVSIEQLRKLQIYANTAANLLGKSPDSLECNSHNFYSKFFDFKFYEKMVSNIHQLSFSIEKIFC